jgi:hypothetical protein
LDDKDRKKSKSEKELSWSDVILILREEGIAEVKSELNLLTF